ncbi:MULTISPECIES: DUF6171 family protein [Metabacillus]|jgi:hypothetical protein|uniref:Uncharacterized protein n=3 Tax=Metabacillus TaxID=2675233 RepID=A0A179SZB3_9BACI|nr:DUF6171 family protein [Metabacillus sp. KUDC1714]OAS86781.1 hypothetical protein A6K24_04535 [Metabacillus litoralis]QNF29147.1 hypothetical protein HUW50_17670 [Metabacillus sp. KUDC1714]
MATNVCKSCTRNVIIKKQEIDQILSKSKVHESQMVSNELFEQRMTLCKSCPSLIYGTTCTHSGCLVEYRAKFSIKRCPNPSGSRW